ncbi:MAG TPA: lysine--tRNA ligase [Firmicutes bacterium]|nr:lysine--tRNA ligase [Bacillota bacterium]
MTDHPAPEQDSADYREIKLEKLKKLQEQGRDPFHSVRYDRSHCAAAVIRHFDELEGQEVTLGGRIVSKRLHGKAGFADLLDGSGRVQLYFKQDTIGDEAFELYKELDLGDIIGLRGTVMKTRTGQETVAVSEYTLLTKILQTLPEKWHGLQDVEQRYRQRYVDMIANPEVRERFRLRSRAVSEIRRFLDSLGFYEVETPMLHAICGGATAEPFVTHWNVLKADYYLRIAIELHLKRLIVGGMEKVYEIGRVFRNEGLSTRHNPEFTMLELYWAYRDYSDIMQLTEDLVVDLCDSVIGSRTVAYGEHELDFTPPFARMTFDEAMQEYAGCGLADLVTLDDVKREAGRLGLELPKDGGYEKCLDEIFKEKVEPNLVQPTFIYDYPVGLSPLAKRHPDNPDLVYRFELFAATFELANSFSEANDPLDQRRRLEQQVADKAEGAHELDEDFLTALEFGMPPTGGLGIGIDRLLMVLTGTTAIREVIAFPQLRQK